MDTGVNPHPADARGADDARDAAGRKYYRFSVGGLYDVAEIKGHRCGGLEGLFVRLRVALRL